MAVLNKTDVIEALAKELDISKADAKRNLEALQKVVTEALSKGKVTGKESSSNRKVTLSGFAKFVVKKRGKRKMRNPQTGKQITVPAKNVVKIKALKGLEDAIK